MPSDKVTIVNKLGLHARAAAKFVKLASEFQADIHLGRDGHEVNGKSIMGVLMLAAGQGTELDLRVEGNDEVEAMTRLQQLIADRFGEEA